MSDGINSVVDVSMAYCTSSHRRIILALHHPLPISLVAHHPCKILMMMKFFYATFHRHWQCPSILTWMMQLNIIRYKMFHPAPFALCYPVTSIWHSLDVPHQRQQHCSSYPRYAPICYRILLIPVTGTCQLFGGHQTQLLGDPEDGEIQHCCQPGLMPAACRP